MLRIVIISLHTEADSEESTEDEMPRLTDSHGDPITWRTCAIRLREDQIIPILQILTENQQWRQLVPHIRKYNGEKFSEFQTAIFDKLSVTSSAKMVINVWFTQIPTVAKMRRVFNEAGLNALVNYMERLVSDGSQDTTDFSASIECHGASGTTGTTSSSRMAPFALGKHQFRPEPSGENPMKVSTYRLEFFKMDEIEKVTENFSPRFRIGEGTFGGVYRVTLGGREVAVKRLAGISPYFRSHQAEYQAAVNYVSRLQHPNLLKLLGHARGRDRQTNEEEFALIYEYMSLGDLAKHLRTEEMRQKMDFEVRYGIAEGTIAGLAYFNSQVNEHGRSYVHRDVKSANILLDKNYLPKLADFGCFTLGARGTGGSQVFERQETLGTAPYMAPEIRGHNGVEHIITTKGDTFAFGIVVFELLFGQLATVGMNFRQMAENTNQPPDESIEWGDQIQGSKLAVASFFRYVGLLCTVNEWDLRPDTRQVADIFQNRDWDGLKQLVGKYKDEKRAKSGK